MTLLEIGYSTRNGSDHRATLGEPPVSSMMVEHVTPAHGGGHAPEAVGVAGDVRDDVPDRPIGEVRRGPRLLVGEPIDIVEQPPVAGRQPARSREARPVPR